MYVTINNVQRVCSITGGAADTDEGEYIAEVIRNNLEKMVIEAQPVKRGEWEKKSSVGVFRCSLCQHIFMLGADEIDEYHFCPHCGADMRGEQK
jgi:rRNA maturation endonuclease Nob1